MMADPLFEVWPVTVDAHNFVAHPPARRHLPDRGTAVRAVTKLIALAGRAGRPMQLWFRPAFTLGKVLQESGIRHP